MWSCLRQVVRGHARTPLPVVPALPLPVRPVWVWSRLFASTGDPYGPTPASPTQRYRELSPYTGGSERAARRAHTYRWAKPVKNVLLVKQAGDENATEWAWYSQWGQGGYGRGLLTFQFSSVISDQWFSESMVVYDVSRVSLVTAD